VLSGEAQQSSPVQHQNTPGKLPTVFIDQGLRSPGIAAIKITWRGSGSKPFASLSPHDALPAPSIFL